ncbi:MAG: hypothetical protein ABI151_09070 [Chitinophagaceae bacterium]
MATITININSDDKLSLAASNESAEVNTAEHSSDGGAPHFDSGSTTTASSSGQLDIGGPPQWLSEALSKDGKDRENVSASDSLQQMEDGDAGASKVTLN